jgi:DNA-binding MarR family transcriptional regulator
MIIFFGDLLKQAIVINTIACFVLYTKTTKMDYDLLKLENQLCFPLYAASRLMTREYQPHLDKLGVTYPQYLVLMILWEKDGMPVNDIAKKLILNTNTITPLLKRMEGMGIIDRLKCEEDERRVLVFLTSKGKKMKKEAVEIPHILTKELTSGEMEVKDIVALRNQLSTLIELLSDLNKK